MMNAIFIGMMAVGVAFSAACGRLGAYSEGLLQSSEKAVAFIIALMGIMGVWSGMMNIAGETGLIAALANKSGRFMRFLFPAGARPETASMMLMAFAANIFGAGNSATAFSIRAMAMLDEENRQRPRASDAMCMFAAVNMAMIQLVPITVIKLRSEAGSMHPQDIIVPSILAGLLSTAVSVAVCKWYERRAHG